jgi:hypothetical protein
MLTAHVAAAQRATIAVTEGPLPIQGIARPAMTRQIDGKRAGKFRRTIDDACLLIRAGCTLAPVQNLLFRSAVSRPSVPGEKERATRIDPGGYRATNVTVAVRHGFVVGVVDGGGTARW